jgi:hypothetical protein
VMVLKKKNLTLLLKLRLHCQTKLFFGNISPYRHRM